MQTVIDFGYKDKKEYLFFLSSLFLLSLFATLIYMPEYRLYPGIDGYFHHDRIQCLTDAIRDSSFPVYIDSKAANGYGYGVKLFYSDFTLIPIALIALVTDVVFANRIFIFLLLFLCGYFSYVAISKIFSSKRVAYLAALLIAFGLFKLAGLFIRFSLGEAFSYVFIPIIVWGFYEILEGNYKKWYIFSIGFSLLIMSHLMTSMLTALMLFVVIIFRYKRFVEEKKRFYSLIIAGIVVVFLSAYGILPLFEQLSTNIFYHTYHRDILCPALTKLDYASSIKGLFSGFNVDNSVVLFDVGTGLLLTILVLLRVFVREKSSQIKLADYCLVFGLLFIVSANQIFPWGRFPFTLLRSIQTPTRLFEYVTFFWSIAGAVYIISIIKNRRQFLIAYSSIVFLIVVQLIINSYNFRNSNFHNNLTSPVPSVANTYNLGAYDYVPAKYVHSDYNFWDRIGERKEEIDCQNKETIISDYSHVKSQIKFDVDTKLGIDSMIIPLFYYKGYTAVFNNKEKLSVTQSENGLLLVPAEGKGSVKVDFTGTFVQRYSLYISLFSFILLIYYIFRQKKERLIVN